MPSKTSKKQGWMVVILTALIASTVMGLATASPAGARISGGVNPQPSCPIDPDSSKCYVARVSIWLEPSSILTGQQTTLKWSSSYTQSCAINGGDFGLNGSMLLGPFNSAGSYSWNIACVGAGTGNNPTGTATLTVTDQAPPPPPPPPPSGDTASPTTPTSLRATGVTSSSVSLAWNASTDNVGVTGYQVFRNGAHIATVTGTSYVNSGLTASTSYGYTVRARDAAGNVSGMSTTLSVTTTDTYDSAYYYGTQEEESFLSQFCGLSNNGPLAVCSTGGTNARCYRVGVSVWKRNAITMIWRYTHALKFCANGSIVTSVWDRTTYGEILIPAAVRPIYPWTWSTIADSPPTPGKTTTISYVKGRFSVSMLKFFPLTITNEPWIGFQIQGNGQAYCQTSVGRVRNCEVPR